MSLFPVGTTIIRKNNGPLVVYATVRDSGILLTIRYLCEPRQRRGTEPAIWEDILKAFAQENKITFAYPTQRFVTTHSQIDSQVNLGQ